MWSPELIALSRIHLEIDGIHVKSLDGEFGILRIDDKNNIYRIYVYDKENQPPVTFNSVNEILIAGWAVD